MLYAAICIDKPGHLETRLAARPEHLAYLASLGDRLRAAGAMLGPDGQSPMGSMLIYECADLAEAQKLAADDPFATGGLFASVDVRPWRQAVGVKLAG